MALDALLRQVSRDLNANLVAVHRDQLVPQIYKDRSLEQKRSDDFYRDAENHLANEARSSLLGTLQERATAERVHESRIADRREAAELRIRAARAEAEEIVRATEADARSHLAYMCVSAGGRPASAAAASTQPCPQDCAPDCRSRSCT